MGREKNTTTAKLPFKSKALEVRKPTDGQNVAMAMASSGKTNGKALVRIFRVLESLFVRPEDWDWFESHLLEGTAELNDYVDFMKDVFTYEWPEDEDTADGE